MTRRVLALSFVAIVSLVRVDGSYVTQILKAAQQVDAELMRIHHALRNIAGWPSPASGENSNMRASLRRVFK
jgi:hypothetical protein